MKFVMVSGTKYLGKSLPARNCSFLASSANRTHSIIFLPFKLHPYLNQSHGVFPQNSAIVHRHLAPPGKILCTSFNACQVPLTSGGGQGSRQPPKKAPRGCYPSMHPSNISPSKPLQQETAQNPRKQLPKSSPTYIPLILKFTPVCGVPASGTLTWVLKLSYPCCNTTRPTPTPNRTSEIDRFGAGHGTDDYASRPDLS
jgi:hypothetical protein